MRVSRHILIIFLVLLWTVFPKSLLAQLGFQLDIPKPKPYENRVLRAEKTSDKKLRASKRFFQNLTTHYNYFFNASNKLNDVISRAKAAHRDNYNLLLPFYNYSLDATALDKVQLDSVIYKSQSGIVSHDLRSDWIDNLYLLWGAAFFLEKKFDSAALMFQFINYAFASKEKDGYYKYIGSRLDGNDALTIATKEDDRFVKRVFETPPSRNSALLWQVRAQIESDNTSLAGTLIATLRNDPAFPDRLKTELEEVQAYWFYKQNIWDSAAYHLANALGRAQDKQELARWEYLTAQLYERSGKTEQAGQYYAKALGHTTDPILDVYARLNLVRTNKTSDEHYVDQNIADLVRMAKRDKYADYRDVIYFMAARMEMERNHRDAAREYLIKGSRYNNGNMEAHLNALLQIAELAYMQKNYLQAAAYYDSIQTNALDSVMIAHMTERKPALAKVVRYSAVISRQDSLQKIAALPEKDRIAYVTKLAKQLRRQKGLKEEAELTAGSNVTANSQSLFTGQPKGEWYFYNGALKAQGNTMFKQVWGNRPNVDNWRRFTDVNKQLLAKVPNNTRPATGENTVSAPQQSTAITAESLLAGLPLTPESLKVSNDSLRQAMYALALTYLNEMDDYASAVDASEQLIKRFPEQGNNDELLFHLYYAYLKSGHQDKALAVRKQLTDKQPNSRFASLVTTGKDPLQLNERSAEATKAYESIYDLFIEGKFEEAEAGKKRADSMYRTNYWQPQLLYIEAVYHIKQREDSLAQTLLNRLVAQNPATPLAAKAQNLAQVLARRKQIEDELNRYEISKPTDTATVAPEAVAAKPQEPPPARITAKMDTSRMLAQNKVVARTVPHIGVDTSAKKLIKSVKPSTAYMFDPASKHYAMIVLTKVDPVFGNETRNAFTRYNKETYYNQPLDINALQLDSSHRLLLIGDFSNAQDAIDYALKAKKIAATEIIPWLKPDKYAISIISLPNLDILKNTTELSAYNKFLEQNLPGKF